MNLLKVVTVKGLPLLFPRSFGSAVRSRLSQSSVCVHPDYKVAAPTSARFHAVLPAAKIELTESKVSVCGNELVIIQPKDVDEVLDLYIEQDRMDGDPYWCRLWPSSIALAEEVLLNPQLVAELHVCDLGAGLGLAGLAAILSGAKEVVFYDQEPLALICCLFTVQANVPQATNLSNILQLISSTLEPNSEGMWGSPLWQSAISLPTISPHLTQYEDFTVREGNTSIPAARAELFDWSIEEVPVGSFDVVLACDVLYAKTAAYFISKLLPRLLHRREIGKVLITDPTKRTPHNRKQFLKLLDNPSDYQGFMLEKMERRTPMMDGTSHDVEFMFLTQMYCTSCS
eukprot:c26663_g1_i1 orf=352-1380(-)